MVEGPRTIALSIENGFAARLLLRSGVLRALQEEGHRIVILSPNAHEAYFQREFGSERTFFRSLVRQGGRVRRRLAAYFDWVWRTVALHSIVSDVWVKEIERLRPQSEVRYRLLKLLKATLGGNRAAVRVLAWLDRLLVRDSYHRAVFEEFQPDLLVVTSYGYHPGDLSLMRRARRAGVPVLCVVLYWDNTGSRGVMREQPDRFVVWDQVNRWELVEYLGVQGGHIYVAGAPHFDIYARPETYCSWGEYCQCMGMDPDRRLIVLCGTTPDVTNGFDDIVQFLAEAIEQDRFVEPCQLLVRPHPITFSGSPPGQAMREDFDRYRSFGRYVFCDDLPILSESLRFDMDGRDIQHLAETLFYASLTVNFFSSITIDAAAVDTPSVVVAFDGHQNPDYYSSARRARDSWNNYPLLMAGVRVAHSFDELVDHINAYLRDPSLESEGRRRIVQDFLYRLDGRATERVARAISLYAQGRWILDEEPQEPSAPDQPAALYKERGARYGVRG